MKALNNLLSKQDCMDLAPAMCNSFYYSREDEFEILRNNNVPEDIDSVMLIYDTHVTALICYNILKTYSNTSLVWREACYSIEGEDEKNVIEEWIIITDCYKTKK